VRRAIATQNLSRSQSGGPSKAMTKKDGAGGRGTWGKQGDKSNYSARPTSKKDPNYDSEGEDGIVYQVSQ